MIDVLAERASTQPNDVGYVFIGDRQTATEELTYDELWQWSLHIAARIRDSCRSGDRVLLLFPSGLEYIAALFGCFCAGVIAVPAYPPNRRHQNRLRSITADARPQITLTTSDLKPQLTGECDSAAALTKHVISVHRPQTQTHHAPPDDVVSHSPAFLQYTSGSTGNPRGVRISHANLMHNQQMIKSAFGHTPDSVILGWLPLFHDMGLVGNVLQPLFVGAKCILMSPISFLQKPARWLQAISDFGATTSGGPDFAYKLCVDRISPEQMANLNLSTWKVAFNGSEIVRRSTIDDFTTTFADVGFRPEAMLPCYGMAEATLYVSGTDRNESPNSMSACAEALAAGRLQPAAGGRPRLDLVSCGRTPDGQTARIVNPQTHEPCDEGHVGEIWVAGPNVANGYWQGSLETRATFSAVIPSTGEGGFLRTGDLGAIYADQLWVTGRIKDTIVIRGRNLYPTDIEDVVRQSHQKLKRHTSAAFSVCNDDRERLIIIQEISGREARNENLTIIAADIREAVTRQFEVRAEEILFVQPGGIPKTSSGKIMRSTCRDYYSAGTLQSFSHT